MQLIAVMTILLLGEAALAILVSTLPVAKTLIGIGAILEPRKLTEVLQVNFASPGHELFTAAFDLAQFKVIMQFILNFVLSPCLILKEKNWRFAIS
jgi:hypothetical protein